MYYENRKVAVSVRSSENFTGFNDPKLEETLQLFCPLMITVEEKGNTGNCFFSSC